VVGARVRGVDPVNVSTTPQREREDRITPIDPPNMDGVANQGLGVIVDNASQGQPMLYAEVVNGGVGPHIGHNEPNEAVTFKCAVEGCGKEYGTSRGLGQHIRIRHKEMYNDNIDVDRIKARWSVEEVLLLAKAEVEIVMSGFCQNINMQLHSKFPKRTLEAIKGRRKMATYRSEVASRLERIQRRSTIINIRRSLGRETAARITNKDEIRAQVMELASSFSTNENRCAIQKLVSIADEIMTGIVRPDQLKEWVDQAIPERRVPVSRPESEQVRPKGNSRARRKMAYAMTQNLWRKNRKAAVESIVKPVTGVTRSPESERMFKYWGDLVSSEPEYEAPQEASSSSALKDIWLPVTESEVAANEIRLGSAPGPDGTSVKSWRGVPIKARTLFFNLVMFTERIPDFLNLGRTIFIPKTGEGSEDPKDFRPITMSSVITRHFHKILASRLSKMHSWDQRQRAFLPYDGCAENLTVLNTFIHTARSKRRELHMASVDISKAFDSVPFGAVVHEVVSEGANDGFVNYIEDLYGNSKTILQYGGIDRKVAVKKGVRQGDPLSPLLFNLVIEKGLKELNSDVGFTLNNEVCNAIAYADDVILVASTQKGLELNMESFGNSLASVGLELNRAKCNVLSMVPSGREKKVKVLTEPTIKYKGEYISQVGVLGLWKYLGVQFEGTSSTFGGGKFLDDVAMVGKSALKPQQKMSALRDFIIPKYLHAWVLGRYCNKSLKKLDVKVRGAVRKWLHLPHDCPLGFFHTAVKQGGLGVPALQFLIPLLKINRLQNLRSSSSRVVKNVVESDIVKDQIAKLQRHLAAVAPNGGKGQLERYWASKLYESVDGKELRDVPHTSASSSWVSYNSHILSGADYVHSVHVRINCLPSRARTLRGRGCERDKWCRAGCRRPETPYHIVQECHRTHGGRVLRHNKISSTLCTYLRTKGWHVIEEPRLFTVSGLRKPDLVCVKGDRNCVVDSQLVNNH
jgi:hypothetical protein